MNLLRLLFIEDLREFGVIKACAGLTLALIVVLLVILFTTPAPPFLGQRFLVWFEFVSIASIKLLIYFMFLNKKTVAKVPEILCTTEDVRQITGGLSLYLTSVLFVFACWLELVGNSLIVQNSNFFSPNIYLKRFLDSFLFAQISISLLIARLNSGMRNDIKISLPEMMLILASNLVVVYAEARELDWQLGVFCIIVSVVLAAVNYVSLTGFHK